MGTALGSKIGFTQKEWNDFGVTDLRVVHFVRSGDEYLKRALK